MTSNISQGDNVAELPVGQKYFLAGGPWPRGLINRESARHELNLMSKHLARGGAGEEQGVEEDAFAKRQIEWRNLTVLKADGLGQVRGQPPVGKKDGDVGDPKLGVVDDERRSKIHLGEGDFPRPVLVTAMLHPRKERDIENQRDDADDHYSLEWR
jgi:hypothetical protein